MLERARSKVDGAFQALLNPLRQQRAIELEQPPSKPPERGGDSKRRRPEDSLETVGGGHADRIARGVAANADSIRVGPSGTLTA